MAKYECNLTDVERDQGWDCPFDNPNEADDYETCEGCCFAKEIEEG